MRRVIRMRRTLRVHLILGRLLAVLFGRVLIVLLLLFYLFWWII